eukprot:gene453-480_t
MNSLAASIKEQLCYVSQDLVQLMRRIQSHGLHSTLSGEGGAGIYVLPDYHRVMKGYVATDPDEYRQLQRQRIARSQSQGGKPSSQSDKEPELQGLGPWYVEGGADTTLVLGSERAAVPELLFRPHDSSLGLDQAGVAEATWQALESLSQTDMGLLCNNVILTGGNVLFPGFLERFRAELRAFVPTHIDLNYAVVSVQANQDKASAESLLPLVCRVREICSVLTADWSVLQVSLVPDPITYAWRGAAAFARSEASSRALVSRSQYLENGHHFCNQRFAEDLLW